MSEQEGQAETQFALQRIYVRDASFESPRAPGVFREQWKPRVNLDLNSRYSGIDDSLYEVVLSLTVTTRNESEEVLYLAEIQQAGIFLVKGMSGDHLAQTLGSFCPSVLFPYAREA
ncbi:MAG: protein-export chaperone SecB, partial [Pseudohongiellaceae bacterium]